MSKLLILILQVTCYIALVAAMEFFEAGIPMVAFAFYMYGTAYVYINESLRERNK